MNATDALDATDRAILAAVRFEPQNTAQIARAAGVSRAAATESLSTLVDVRLIDRVDGGVRFRLPIPAITDPSADTDADREAAARALATLTPILSERLRIWLNGGYGLIYFLPITVQLTVAFADGERVTAAPGYYVLTVMERDGAPEAHRFTSAADMVEYARSIGWAG